MGKEAVLPTTVLDWPAIRSALAATPRPWHLVELPGNSEIHTRARVIDCHGESVLTTHKPWAHLIVAAVNSLSVDEAEALHKETDPGVLHFVLPRSGEKPMLPGFEEE